MKHLTFYLTIISIFCVQLFAQVENSALSLKVNSGLTFANLANDNLISNFGPFDQMFLNFSGGISALYSPNPNYGFETGLRYSVCGAKTQDFRGTDEQGNELGDFWFVRELQFIEVPVHFIYQFDAKTITPFVFLGPNFAFLLDAEERLESDYGEDAWNSNIKEKLNNVNVSAEVGAGLKYNLNNRTALGISAVYLLGLTNQVKAAYKGESKSRDFRVYASLYYNLR